MITMAEVPQQGAKHITPGWLEDYPEPGPEPARFLTKCKGCGTAHAIEVKPSHASSFFTDSFNGQRKYKPHEFHRTGPTEWIKCQCGKTLRDWKKVSGTYKPDVKCDARCTNAFRPNCDCECGGANHGSSH